MRPDDESGVRPLLAPGRHDLSFAELRALCVDSFPLSETRSTVMLSLERLLSALGAAGVPGEIWVGGSVLSSKPNPNDIDVVLATEAAFYDRATESQRDAIRRLGEPMRTEDPHCDSYYFFNWPREDPLWRFGNARWLYWDNWLGHDRAGNARGYAVLKLGGES